MAEEAKSRDSIAASSCSCRSSPPRRARSGLARAPSPRAGRSASAPAAPPLPPLGNGEPVSWTFQPYPGGTGAMMEKLVREHGAPRSSARRSPCQVDRRRCRRPREIAFLPAHRLSALIKERKITSTQAHATSISTASSDSIPTLLCAVTIMEEQAMAEAAKADAEIKAGKYRGPLHGIPYGVKDLFSTKGVRTTWGSADFENRIIDEDAEVVVRLRDAGAVLMAKLATGLFAQGDQWYRGRTNNPWDISRGSSGSSAGPASATAAGCVAFGIGTETSGSIVSPARECGLERAASDVRAREPLRRDGAGVVAGSSRPDLPDDRGLRDGVQRDSRRG